MEHIPKILKGASTVMQATGAQQTGQAEGMAAEFSARQYDENAVAAEAKSIQVSNQERRKATLMQSRARAVAAAGGGMVTDPGMTDIMADIGEEGELNALTALWEGNVEASGLRKQAYATRLTGKAKERAGNIKAVSHVMSGAHDLFSRFRPGSDSETTKQRTSRRSTFGGRNYG